MHETLFRLATIMQDAWQNIAIVVLGTDRAVAWYRRRKTIARAVRV